MLDRLRPDDLSALYQECARVSHCVAIGEADAVRTGCQKGLPDGWLKELLHPPDANSKPPIELLLRVTQAECCGPILREEFLTLAQCSHVHEHNARKRRHLLANLSQVDHLLTAECSTEMSQKDKQGWIGGDHIAKRRRDNVPAAHGSPDRHGKQVVVDFGRRRCLAHDADQYSGISFWKVLRPHDP